MAVSTARVLHSSTAAALQERPAAKIIPFKGRRREPLEEPRCGGTNAQMAQVIQLADRRKPLEEPIAGRANAQVISVPALNSPKEQQARPSAQVLAFPAHDANPRSKPANSHDAETCQAIKAEASREVGSRGKKTKSQEKLDSHFQLAWALWVIFVTIMLSMGIRASETQVPENHVHEPMKRGG